MHGRGDIPGTVRGGMFGSYSIEWLSAPGSIAAGGHNEGVVASFNIEAELHPTPRLTLSFGPEGCRGMLRTALSLQIKRSG